MPLLQVIKTYNNRELRSFFVSPCHYSQVPTSNLREESLNKSTQIGQSFHLEGGVLACTLRKFILIQGTIFVYHSQFCQPNFYHCLPCIISTVFGMISTTLSEQLAHSAVDLHLKEISEFLHGSEMKKNPTLS